MNEQPAPEARSREGALAEASTLSTVGLVAGVLGATALVFGLVLYAIDPGVVALSVLNASFAIVALIFYATTNTRSLGRAFSGRSTAFIALEAVTIAGVIGGFVAVNWFASKSQVEWDLTRDRLFSLHEQSQKVAAGLKAPVKVVGFFKSTEAQRNELVSLVELYRKYTDQLELEFISPDSAPPAVMKQYQMSEKSPRIVIAASNGQTTKIRQATEELFTNALMKVSGKPPRRVSFLVGHGEPNIDDVKAELAFERAAAELRDEGYEVATVSLVDRETVPSDIDVIIVAGPKTALLANEVKALAGWVDRGGRLLLMLEPGRETGLEAFARNYGIDVGDNVVVDPNPATRASGYGPDTTVVQKFEAHPICDPLRNVAALFQGSRSVSPQLGQAKIKVSTLVQTSAASWAETKYRAGGDPERDEEDLVGPVPIAVAATFDTLTVQDRVGDQARLVVFGDSTFAANRFASMGANGDLFSNSINWLIGDEEKITIRPKARGSSRIPLTETEQYGIMFFSVNLLPLLIIGFGFSVWAVRRRK